MTELLTAISSHLHFLTHIQLTQIVLSNFAIDLPSLPASLILLNSSIIFRTQIGTRPRLHCPPDGLSGNLHQILICIFKSSRQINERYFVVHSRTFFKWREIDFNSHSNMRETQWGVEHGGETNRIWAAVGCTTASAASASWLCHYSVRVNHRPPRSRPNHFGKILLAVCARLIALFQIKIVIYFGDE